jgi:DNA polymerase sigma
METALKICSKAKCKVVLPPELPGQQYFKTCEKCRNADALRRKRKREEKDQETHERAAQSAPSLQRQKTPMATMMENNPSIQDNMSAEETDKEDDATQVRLESTLICEIDSLLE